MSDSYRRGVDLLDEIGIKPEPTANRAAEVAPELVGAAIGVLYGDFYSRPGLDLATREIAAVSALAAMGNVYPQLRAHVAAALKLGWTKAQLIEVIIQIAAFAGFPAAMNALAQCHDMLATSGGSSQPCHSSGLGDGH